MREHRHFVEADRLIFNGHRPGTPLSNGTIPALIKKHDIGGCRMGSLPVSSSGCKSRPTRGEIAVACLTHSNRNKVEAAYARSDYLEKRRGVIQDWADYVLGRE